MKVLREWTINAPWGKIAMVSWGNEAGSPVLLVHGRRDSAATFEPLLQLLPDSYHYVALDLPGHGRSDPFPAGLVPSRLNFVGAVQVAVWHLRWKQFIFVGHSMGCEGGLFFNTVYPHRISKMILLDPGPALARLQVHDPQEYFASFHQKYYDNYDKFAQKRIYSKERAVEAVMKARGFTESQAHLVLSRNMVRVGEDLYELSWDPRLLCLPPPNYPPSYYHQLFCTPTPTLLIAAKEFQGSNGKRETLKLISDLEKTLENFTVVTVEGGHNAHFTNPERFLKVLCEFLDKKFECKSKL
ncbi:serine hydrolase-like protein [Cydia strobilella]|uniref:serine hydrolase-like protein n=1 Tax=Cydia strobilella TaxID=1100964 RepID=UPI0030070757